MAIVTDNATNNNTMMKKLEEIWTRDGIPFDHMRHHVRCLAHVMNLAIQSALTDICCQPSTNENQEQNVPSSLYKVKKKALCALINLLIN
jgi:hypothetical protein